MVGATTLQIALLRGEVVLAAMYENCSAEREEANARIAELEGDIDRLLKDLLIARLEIEGLEEDAEEMEAESSALWAYVWAEDDVLECLDEDFDSFLKAAWEYREAIRQYEEKPFTYNADAPLKLA